MPGKNDVSSVNESLILEICHYGPVTAIKVHKNSIFVGYGPILKVFEIDSSSNAITLNSSQRAFKRNKIHSIDVLGSKVCVAGARSFAVVDLSSGSNIQEKAINEWIVSSKFLDTNTLLLLTSHNEVLKIDIRDLMHFQFNVVDKIHCNEKSILYSGSITITNTGKVYVAAGTVMSGVIVWDLQTREILRVLTAHEGSIFGVIISPDGKYIISCSDDRSVKLCDFSTGNVLASGWGHGSRIWSLQFVSFSNESVDIFSTGEDCTARLWHYEAGSDSLVQTQLWDHCHLGKHIWSGDIDMANIGAAVTGGADGKLRIHDISALGKGVSSYSPQDITFMTGAVFEKKEVIKQFAELSECDLLVVVTTLGKVFTLFEASQWTQVSISEDDTSIIKESGMLHAFSSLNAAAIFTRLGDVLALSFHTSGELKSLEWIKGNDEPSKKIINVLMDEDKKKKEFYALLDCPNPNIPFEVKKFALRNDKLTVTASIELFKPDPKVFTPTSVHFDARNQWLLVGSRHANFAIYNLAGEHYQLPLLVRKVCPGDTITTISTVKSADNHLVALLTVRDGTYLYMSISQENEKFMFEIILQNKVSRGIIEGGFVEKDDLYLYGFRASSFYLWNETKQIEIDHHLCGGAHRQWELIRHKGQFDYKFIYLNKSSLIMKGFHCRFNDSNRGLLIGGTHGREIRGVAVCPVQEQDGTRLLATASEDATIKLGKLDLNGNVANLWTMNNHISGLQTIDFMNQQYLASSAANEELLIWKVHRISSSVLTIVEHSRLSVSDENPDLRIMDFASLEVDGGFWVAAVFSNSKIKVFFYDTEKKAFTLCIDDTYSTFCILNVNFITHNNQTYLMTGTTDGFITIWDVSSSLSTLNIHKLERLVVQQQLHQSGVKAVTIIPANNKWKLITGGDDNALVLSILTPTADGITLETVSFVEDAASATITGLSNVGNDKVFATSVDQIVRLWSISDDTLTCDSASYTTVADTGCCDTTEFNGQHLGVVGGAGLGLWTITK